MKFLLRLFTPFSSILAKLPIAAVVLLFMCGPLYGQLNFNGFGMGDPASTIFFTSGFGSSAFPFTPSNGTGPYLFEYAPGAPLIPGFRVINWPDLPGMWVSSVDHAGHRSTAPAWGMPWISQFGRLVELRLTSSP
jgi:hypothetical protein